MGFEVCLTRDAEADFDAILEGTAETWSPEQASRWGAEMSAAIDSLEHFPRRCRLARTASASREIRVLDIGRGRNRILAYFEVDGDLVRVVRLLHSRRDERL